MGVLGVALLLGLFDPSSLGPYAKKGVHGDFLRAIELENARKFAQAGPIFEDLVTRYPLLAPIHAYHGARCAYFAGRHRAALRLLDNVPADSVLDAEARLLRADVLRARDDDEGAARVYRAYLERYPKGMRRAEVHFRLGDFRRAYILGTGTAWADKTAGKVDPSTLTASERVERATILFDAMRNEDAEKAFIDALGAPELTPEVECTARFFAGETVFRQRSRERAAPLYDAAAAACERAKNEDLRVRALYQAGRCLNNAGKFAEAAKRLHIVQAARHSYADDARLREAEGAADAGDAKAEAALLSSIPASFPEGDTVGEAIWRLARAAVERGQWAEALDWLDKGLVLIPRETEFWAEGRTLYWRGRALLELGRADEARESFSRCIHDYPLTYYALLAFNRLRERFADDARALEGELIAPIPERPEAMTFADRPLFSMPGFQRAVELIRLGMGRDAQRELQAIGVVEGGAQEDSLWLAAALYDRAGRWRDAHWIPRKSLTGYKVSHPLGSNAARWRLAYPRGFASMVEREAQRNDIPPALLYSIIREESAFDAEIESWANAIGLTQLLVPTAKRFADGTRVTPESLRRPEVNLKIGARFLAFLWKRFDATAPLAVAAYNAGEGAVDRWLRERGALDLDLFVEKIPYDQTRRYTKRVLSSYFTYQALAAQKNAAIPSVPTRRAAARARASGAGGGPTAPAAALP